MAAAFVMLYVMIYGGAAAIGFIVLFYSEWKSRKEKIEKHDKELKQIISIINDRLKQFSVGCYISHWNGYDYRYYRVEGITLGETIEEKGHVKLKTIPRLYAGLVGLNEKWPVIPESFKGIREFVELEGYEKKTDTPYSGNFMYYDRSFSSSTKKGSKDIYELKPRWCIKKVEKESIKYPLDS